MPGHYSAQPSHKVKSNLDGQNVGMELGHGTVHTWLQQHHWEHRISQVVMTRKLGLSALLKKSKAQAPEDPKSWPP